MSKLIQTPVGTLSFPHLFKPRPKAQGSEELVFQTLLLFNEQQMKSPAYKAMIQAIEEVAKAAYPKLILGKSLKSPIRRCDEKENMPKEYIHFFSTWSKIKPAVVDTGRNRIVDSNDVWGGQYARLSVDIYAWNHTSGGKGVNLGLQHVQIVKSEGLERFDGRKTPEESFDNEFDQSDANANEDIDV